MVTTPSDVWASRMKHYWPRIYRFLDQPLNPPAHPRGWPPGGIEYRFSTFTGMDLDGRAGYARPLKRDGVVTLEFHPALESKPPALLIGTLAHEGLHAIMLALTGEASLWPAQTLRLISSHWAGQVPPGYGARLAQIHTRTPGEIGVELLTNKLLIQHDLTPLERTLPYGDYVQ